MDATPAAHAGPVLRPWPWPPALDAVWLALAAFLAHGLTIALGGFVYDDPMVLNAPVVVDGRWELVWHPRDYFEVSAGEASWRPVATLTHLVDRMVGMGSLGAVWAHGVNVALHAAVVVLGFALVRRLGFPRLAALLGAGLFAVHPLASEAIGVVTFREEMLAGALAAGAWVLVGPPGVGPGRLVGAAALAFLACGAKETGFMLPVVAALAAWALPLADATIGGQALGPVPAPSSARTHSQALGPVPAPSTARGADSRRARLLRWVVPLTIGVALFAPLRFWLFVAAPEKLGYTGHPGGSLATTALTMSWVLAKYLRLALWPDALCIDHAVSAVRTFDGRAVLGLAAVGAWVALGAWAWRRSPRALVAWGWASAFTIPVLDLVPLPNIIAERYCYLPLAGVAWLGGLAGAAAVERAARRGRGGLALAAVGAVLVAATARTAWRAPEFASDHDLFEAGAIACPGSHRAAYMQTHLLKQTPLVGAELEAALARVDRVEQARGVPLAPGAAYADAREALRIAVDRFRDGNADDRFDVTLARERLHAAVTEHAASLAPPWSPEEAVMWLFTGIAHREWAQTLLERVLPLEARLAQLAHELQQRERAGQETAPVHREVSRVGTMTQGMRPQALDHLATAESWVRRALAGDRLQSVMAAKAWENLGAIAGLRDPGGEAVREHTERALAIESRLPHALFNLGVYWQQRADREAAAGRDWQAVADRALDYYQRAMESPDTVYSAVMSWMSFRRRIRPLFPDSKEFDEVHERWERLCDRWPLHLPLRRQLARELAHAHRHEAAERNVERALMWDPTWGEGWRLWMDVVSEVRPDGTPGDGARALKIADEARRHLDAAAFEAEGIPRRITGLRAGLRQQELWPQKAQRPDDYALWRDIGLNALDIPDYDVARTHLAQARSLDPVRFANEGLEPRWRELDERHRRDAEDTRLREDGDAESLRFRAGREFARADLRAAWGWLEALEKRGDAGTEEADRALRVRARAALDLAEYGSPRELIENAQLAAAENRWPEAVFYWRAARDRDPAAFRDAGGAPALAAAESALESR